MQCGSGICHTEHNTLWGLELDLRNMEAVSEGKSLATQTWIRLTVCVREREREMEGELTLYPLHRHNYFAF